MSTNKTTNIRGVDVVWLAHFLVLQFVCLDWWDCRGNFWLVDWWNIDWLEVLKRRSYNDSAGGSSYVPIANSSVSSLLVYFAAVVVLSVVKPARVHRCKHTKAASNCALIFRLCSLSVSLVPIKTRSQLELEAGIVNKLITNCKRFRYFSFNAS